MQKGCGEFGTANVRGKGRCQQEYQYFFKIQSSGNSNFGTVLLAECANFLFQIFPGKKKCERDQEMDIKLQLH